MNIDAVAYKMQLQQYRWIDDIIKKNVPLWKTLLCDVTRSHRLADMLIGARFEIKEEPSIHAGASSSLVTRVYIRDVLVGELKQFINATKTQPHE